jgi:hypothetical protein
VWPYQSRVNVWDLIKQSKKNEMNENRMKILSDRPGSSNVWFIVLLVPNREGLLANNLFLEWPSSFTQR